MSDTRTRNPNNPTLEHLETALGALDEILLLVDSCGDLLWCNSTFQDWTGRSVEEMRGNPVSILLPLGSRGQLLPEAAHPACRALGLRQSQHGDFDFGEDGPTLRVNATYLEGEKEGEDGSVVLLARDITGETMLEDYRLQAVAFGAAPMAFAILNVRGEILWLNQAFEKLTGHSLWEMYGKPMRVLLTEKQDRAFHRDIFARAAKGEPWQGDLMNRRADGTIYYEFQTVTPVRDEEERLTHFIVTKMDVTERVRDRRRLEAGAAKFKALFAGVVDAIVTADKKGTILSVNPAACQLFGYAEEELIGNNVRMFVPQGLRERHDSFIRNYLETGVARIIGLGREIEAVRKDGTSFPIDLSIAEIRYGDTVNFSAVIRDITDRKRQQAELRQLNEELESRVEKRTEQLVVEIEERRQAEQATLESKVLFKNLLKSIHAAFIILHKETNRMVGINAVAEEMFGLLDENVVGMSCESALGEFDDQTRAALCRLPEEDSGYQEQTLRINGSTMSVARHVLHTTLAGAAHRVVVLFDITERKALEQRLSVTQKLESIGELASGIAHEINTPVQYVGDSVRFINESFLDMKEIVEMYGELANLCREQGLFTDEIKRIDDALEEADKEFLDQELPRAFQRSQEGVEQVATIVRAMKNFSHPGNPGERKAVNLNEAVTNTIVVARNEWKYVADVETDLEADLPTIVGIPGDLNQVILNMVVNAAHAVAGVVGGTDDKGRIIIITRTEGDHVVLTIADSGTGIAPENLPRIYDPFFTTKEVGKGTGQGLAIAHDIIVSRHGGTIDVESTLGEGTTFTIRLPIKESRTEEA
ncbi:MAG: PAS domain S-box protein [Desulfovibrionaceae bacterium]